MNSDRPSLSGRFFRSLMKLFPRDFRGDYGAEMEDMFQAQHADADREGGRLGLFRLWWQVITDIVRTAPREHWEMLKLDSRFAFATMRKNIGFVAAVVITLGLGIGANTAVFSMVNAVLLRPLPYEHGEQLLILRQQARLKNDNDVLFSVKELGDYRAQSHTLEGLAEYHNMFFTLLGHGDPERVQTAVVSANYFGMMGVEPLLGRAFRPADDRPGADAVLLLTYSYWRNHFGSDPNVVGRTFTMNDKVHTVIGVMPALPAYPDDTDVYMPSSACPFRSNAMMIEDRNDRMVRVFARMKPGVRLGQAQADLSLIAKRLEATYPDVYTKDDGYAIQASALTEELTQQARPTFLLLLGTAGLVLLIACCNVVNLTVARLVRRERELALRGALGASRARLFRQLLTEGTILALFGGALGLVLAVSTMDLLTRFAARFTPRAGEVRIDGAVLLFTLAVSVLSAIMFSSFPALSAARDLSEGLKEGARTTNASGKRVRAALVVAQVALSFILLTGAGLMLRTVYNLSAVDPGFHPENVLSMRISLDWSRYTDTPKRLAFYEPLLERVRSQASVRSAAVSLAVPLNTPDGLNGDFEIEPRDSDGGRLHAQAGYRVVSEDYFRTVGVPLLRGRTFTRDDGKDGQRVCIINQRLAKRYWPGRDPLGARVSTDKGKTWAVIAGVVGDVKEYGLDTEPSEQVYLPLRQFPLLSMSLLVRSRVPPMTLAREMTDIVHGVDKNQPVSHVQTLEEIRSSSMASPRLRAILLGLFAALALIITAAGIAGIVAFSVSQRTRELAVRLALGATPRMVLSMVVRHGMGPVLLGLSVGIVGALALTRLLTRLLFDVRPSDPLTFLGVCGGLATAAILACLLPARRVTTIDPMTALRAE